MTRLEAILAAMQRDIDKAGEHDSHWALDALEIHKRRLEAYLEDKGLDDDT